MTGEQRQPVEDPVVPCEGRCGSRLTEEGRERGYLTPQVGDWSPFHTAQRCRAIRTFREAIVEQFAQDVLVDIEPGRGIEHLTARVSYERSGQRVGLTRVVPDYLAVTGPYASSYVLLEANDMAARMRATDRAVDGADTEETPRRHREDVGPAVVATQ